MTNVVIHVKETESQTFTPATSIPMDAEDGQTMQMETAVDIEMDVSESSNSPLFHAPSESTLFPAILGETFNATLEDYLEAEDSSLLQFEDGSYIQTDQGITEATPLIHAR